MWWSIVVVVLVFAIAVYGFARVVGWQTRSMSRRGATSLEESYRRNADAPPRGHHEND